MRRAWGPSNRLRTRRRRSTSQVQEQVSRRPQATDWRAAVTAWDLPQTGQVWCVMASPASNGPFGIAGKLRHNMDAGLRRNQEHLPPMRRADRQGQAEGGGAGGGHRQTQRRLPVG